MAFTTSQLKRLRTADHGARVAEAIRLSGVTQSHIAAATGLRQTWLCDLKAGRIESPSLDNAHRLAQFFGCRIEDLFPPRQAAA